MASLSVTVPGHNSVNLHPLFISFDIFIILNSIALSIYSFVEVHTIFVSQLDKVLLAHIKRVHICTILDRFVYSSFKIVNCYFQTNRTLRDLISIQNSFKLISTTKTSTIILQFFINFDNVTLYATYT